MALLTEDAVRLMSNHGTRGPVVVRSGDVLTPSARSYLREHRIETVFPQGADPASSAGPSQGRYQTLFGAVLDEKPEHMTHLKGNTLVFKDHPRIAFRGMIDLLESEIALCQQVCVREHLAQTAEDLEEVLNFARRFIRFDVLDEAVGDVRLCGYGPQELREYSHYPEKHFGQPHFLIHYTDSPAILAVNRVRAVARQTELAAYRAFKDENGGVARGDIILGLNRLSSLLWIMMIKLKAGTYEHTTRAPGR